MSNPNMPKTKYRPHISSIRKRGMFDSLDECDDKDAKQKELEQRAMVNRKMFRNSIQPSRN